MARCWPSGKLVHDTLLAAREAADRMALRHGGAYEPYRCGEHYHLRSKDKRVTKMKARRAAQLAASLELRRAKQKRWRENRRRRREAGRGSMRGYLDPREDRGACPYYAAYLGRPRPGVEPVCGSGCWEEPRCVTEEPEGGWPSARRLTPKLRKRGAPKASRRVRGMYVRSPGIPPRTVWTGETDSNDDLDRWYGRRWCDGTCTGLYSCARLARLSRMPPRLPEEESVNPTKEQHEVDHEHCAVVSHCHSHHVDEPDDRMFVICPECNHVYRRAASMWRAYVREHFKLFRHDMRRPLIPPMLRTWEPEAHSG